MPNLVTSRRRFPATSCGAVALFRPGRFLAAAPAAPSGKIAFVRGNTLSSADRKIWLINPDGSGLQPLTNSGNSAGKDRPAWSPDGKSIAFSVNGRIAVTAADGQNVDVLTPASPEAGAPGWSPDGKRIAFHAWHPNRESSNIHVMNSDGSEITQLTDGAGHNWMPSWSSDNKNIVFESTRNGNREIYSMSPNGKHVVNLTRHKSTDHSPACCPKSTQIAIMSGRDLRDAQ